MRRLTDTKYAVYTNQDFSGMARGLRNIDRGPAERDRKLGQVRSAVKRN